MPERATRILAASGGAAGVLEGRTAGEVDGETTRGKATIEFAGGAVDGETCAQAANTAAISSTTHNRPMRDPRSDSRPG